jgi:hypothetical protein
MKLKAPINQPNQIPPILLTHDYAFNQQQNFFLLNGQQRQTFFFSSQWKDLDRPFAITLEKTELANMDGFSILMSFKKRNVNSSEDQIIDLLRRRLGKGSELETKSVSLCTRVRSKQNFIDLFTT